MRKLFAGFIILFLSMVGLVSFPSSASAINPAAFDPGRIIDDALFYDPGGMGGVSDIQNFLNAHVPSCDTWGTRASGYGNLTNAQYAQQIKGWPGPPYVCLNNYYENPTTGETSFEKGGGAFNGGQSAAHIIYNAAQDYKINPKVLVVFLRKESLNLFSDSWPMKSQYKYAMGYACPDSGPNYSANCDTSKAGFLKQVRFAAWQLRQYYNNMGTYNYAPGRWNTILYNPNPSCGTKDVYIQNYATASLYIYTPYVPNNAALNAYPGEANCGAYGNRNFWFFWQEWFGSTLTNGNFVRTANDATVYLIGDKTKYPIADGSLISAASVLGGVGFVSSTYLDAIPTGHLLGRTIQSPDGTIYFYDSSIKLPFTSCEMVAAYGSACGSAAILSQVQVDKLVTGPQVTNGMKTTSGRTFVINGGQKREALDDQSLADAGLSGLGFNVLTDSAFGNLQYGVPYTRDNVAIQNRHNANQKLLRVGGVMYSTIRDAVSTKALSSLPTGQLDEPSINKLTTTPIKNVIKDENGNHYVLTQDGKRRITTPESFQLDTTTLSSTTINQLSGSGSLSDPSLIKSYGDATVYVVVNGQKRPLVAMDDLKSITGEDYPYIAWVSNELVNALPTGNVIIGAGRLVKTPSNATVYMTDGYDKLVPMSTFDPAFDMGLQLGIRTISNDILAKYTVDTTLLSPYISCGGTSYVAIGGIVYQTTLSGKTPRTLQAQTCNVLTKKTILPGFLLAPSGTIYQLDNGTIHPITSWAKYTSLSASGGATVKASQSTLSLFTVGSAL